MKFCEIFWGEVKIDVLKGGGGYKQKGNHFTISRCQKVKATIGYHRCKINIPNVQLHYLPDLPF